MVIPARPLNPERTAVILGNAMAGDTASLLCRPDSLSGILPKSSSKLPVSPLCLHSGAPGDHGTAPRGRSAGGLPPITEDTMPGELANIIAGRIAALYDFKGPNFVADAACASAMAAISAAIEGLNAERLRCRSDGRNRYQHEPFHLCQILQDRRSFGHGNAGLMPKAPTVSSWAKAP